MWPVGCVLDGLDENAVRHPATQLDMSLARAGHAIYFLCLVVIMVWLLESCILTGEGRQKMDIVFFFFLMEEEMRWEKKMTARRKTLCSCS